MLTSQSCFCRSDDSPLGALLCTQLRPCACQLQAYPFLELELSPPFSPHDTGGSRCTTATALERSLSHIQRAWI